MLRLSMALVTTSTTVYLQNANCVYCESTVFQFQALLMIIIKKMKYDDDYDFDQEVRCAFSGISLGFL